MDKETALYIIKYFSHLLGGQVMLAIKHTTSTFKIGSTDSGNNVQLTRIFREKGWITENQTVLDLMKDGYERFEMKVAEKILDNYLNEVVLNNCPKCGRLARTPLAKQCRHCGNDWR